MSYHAPILVVTDDESSPTLAALTDAELFPVLASSWPEAGEAVGRLRPSAVVADGGAPVRSLEVLARQIALLQPYVPLIAIGTDGGLPDNVMPFSADPRDLVHLAPRLRAALRVRTLHATAMRRLTDPSGLTELSDTDPLQDATVLLIGRGAAYPALSVALGERVGVVGALSIEAAAKHLNVRDLDGIVLAEGFSPRVVDAFLTVLSEDTRFRHLPIVVGIPAPHGSFELPNLEFVDGDPARAAQAQAALEAAARAVGFADIAFQYEPIAAALHHEASTTREERVLVADIGGGTSDFSLVRVSPQRRQRRDRRDDVLASHGVHIAGTDFDRRVDLGAILPLLGYGSAGPAQPGQPAREVPSPVYFDLATWHLINTLQRPQRLAEVRALRVNFADLTLHRRLLKVVEEHLGHDLLGRAEDAKIEVAEGGVAHIDLGWVERGLAARVTHAEAADWLRDDLRRIVDAARETVTMAGVPANQVDTLFFTGGSTGLSGLTGALCAAFPDARPVFGDRLASVASGLGLCASRWFDAKA